MDTKEFLMLDVFTEKRFFGNQLAVFLHGHLFTDKEMQNIAREINFSETTFVFPRQRKDNTFPVRIFTPQAEVPFAGHPTLGTAFAIQQEFIKEKVSKIDLFMTAGTIPVEMEYQGDEISRLTMRQNEPAFKKVVDSGVMAQVLGVSKEEVDDSFPIQEVSTGLPFIIVPLKTKEAVAKARLHKEAYEKMIADLEAKCLLIFCPQTQHPENQLHARVFAEYLGVYEDPATGSANGCLAAYLLKHRYFGTANELDIRVEQGFEMGRDSILYLKGKEHHHKMEIYIGGQVVNVARGELVE